MSGLGGLSARSGVSQQLITERSTTSRGGGYGAGGNPGQTGRSIPSSARTEDVTTSRCEAALNTLKNERLTLMKRLIAIEEEVDATNSRPVLFEERKVREPVIKKRLPIFLEKKRTRKFLLKK
jgi:hypothetical protein